MRWVLSFRKDHSCPTHSLHFLGLVTRRDRSAQALVSCHLIRSLNCKFFCRRGQLFDVPWQNGVYTSKANSWIFWLKWKNRLKTPKLPHPLLWFIYKFSSTRNFFFISLQDYYLGCLFDIWITAPLPLRKYH